VNELELRAFPSFPRQSCPNCPRTPFGVRQHGYGTPGFASLNPGLMAYQPSGLDSHAGGVLGV